MSLPPPINWLLAGQDNNRYRVIFSDAVFPHYAGIGYFTNLGDALAFLKSGIILSILNSMQDVVDALRVGGRDVKLNPDAWDGIKPGRMNPYDYSVKFNEGDDDGESWLGSITVTAHRTQTVGRTEDRNFTTEILITDKASYTRSYLDSQKMIVPNWIDGKIQITIADTDICVLGRALEFNLEKFNIPDNEQRAYLRQGWWPVWSGYWEVPTKDYLSGSRNSYTAILQSRERFTFPVRQGQTPDQR